LMRIFSLTATKLGNAPSDEMLAFSVPSLSLVQRRVTQADVEYMPDKLSPETQKAPSGRGWSYPTAGHPLPDGGLGLETSS